MSYSFSVPAGPAEELRDRAEQAAAGVKASQGDHWLDEASEDIDAAIDAAGLLAVSLTNGDGRAEVGATISGHANPGRGTPPGWSQDMVSVSVYRVVRAPEAAAEQASPA